jgi:hypothetical protein
MLIRVRCSRVAWLLVSATLVATPELRAQTPAVEAESSLAGAREIVPPQALLTPLAYPAGASGPATVELELTIDRTGAVIDAHALSGEAPFRDAALAALPNFRFSPALRAGRPVAAKIRYSVEFTPPEAPPPPPRPEARAPEVPSHAGSAARRPPPPLEVIVEGERQPTGSVVLTQKDARALPGTFGDPLRAIEAQPGVVPIVSGLPAFFIRGAPPSNVGFFFDGVEIPLLYHAFFGPSVVHPGFIDSIEFHPGAAPAEYGRFAGPIIAVKSRPLGCRMSGEANLRLIDAGGLVESGPLSSTHECATSGARVAGRYSYAGLVLSLLSDAKLDYWDYQVQASYPLGRRDSVSVVAFGGYDLFRAPQASVNAGAELSFHRVDLRWDRKLAAGSLRLAVTGGSDRAAGANVESSFITDQSLRLRSELSQRVASRATLKVGLDTRVDRFGLSPNRRSLDYPDYARLFPARTDTLAGGYVAVELEPVPGIRVAPGVRTDVYTSGGKTVVGVDPRASAEFTVSRVLRLQHSLGIAHQRPNFTAQVPGAQVADLGAGLQWALLWSSGFKLRLPQDLLASATVFRSGYFNALDPVGGARDFTIDRTALDRRATIAAAGLELQLSRPTTKRLGGFISYTLSRSEQSSGTQKAPSGFDRTHVLQAALSYEIVPSLRVGARTVLYSGVPELNLEGSPHFTGDRRGAPFFRLDLRAEKRFRLGRAGYWGVIAEVLNATSTREVVRLDCGEVCRERSAGPVILPSLGLEAGF